MRNTFNNILKHSSSLLLLTTSIGLFYSCEDKEKNFIGTPSPYIALEDVRALHKGSSITLNAENLRGASFIYGTVISDHRFGNVPEGTVVLQQYKRSRLRGLTLQVGADAASYLPGDSIVVNISGKPLVKDGFLTVQDVKNADIEKISSNNRINALTTVAHNINTNPENYEGTMIKVVGGQMYPRPQTGEVFKGTKLMIQATDTIAIETLEGADYADMQVPRNITATGIMLGAKAGSPTKNLIYPRYKKDIVDVSDPDVPEYIGSTPIIITGFCNDPSGGDGNYEYIQLKANTDIDFSKVPFALVTSNNAGTVLHTAGWATGAAKTYKFNLTQGTVKKGEIFYVGGHRKMINGANSTSIASSKWIRAIETSKNPGDGFGNASSNLLANSGNASGIAVFVGTNISEQSVPVDVIFFGNNGPIISDDKTLGYRIANTDHYAQYITETGESTPFFSMGGEAEINDFRFPHQSKEIYDAAPGVFYKLGGQFDVKTRKWIEPRSSTIFVMSKTTTLQEIENGDGTTVQVN